MNYIYELAIIKDNTVESFDRELNIAKVTPVTKGVNEVVFYLVQKLHTDEGEECGGKWFIANIIQTESGYKFLNIWVEDHEYEMMQSHLKNDYLKKNILLEKGHLTEDILDKYKGGAKATLFYDENEPSDKVSNIASQIRKNTLSYDREAVSKAAKKYAYNYNKLFVQYTGAGGDCTNYVSQCIWQSPGWGFDRIGKNNSVKWACKKNSDKKYVYETVSWVGVNELWTYFQINDSFSQAGTVYGVSSTTRGYNSSNVQVGDVIQFYNGNIWRHSVIVSEITDGIVYCAAHSSNYARRKLSEYISLYPTYRVAHINNYILAY
ncbi:amidase domain-containing protein [Johnsonella ignava]|uniref:amidase domain-containing protein n=1 Tax=Johnsonella ignava TaxID=43995 RepID=UPI0023EF7837|nr:amidase domain-containing protein [Johnsonella ignava]